MAATATCTASPVALPERTLPNQLLGQVQRRRCYLRDRHRLQDCEPIVSSLHVTGCRFIENQLRNAKLVVDPPGVPPFPRYLLMACNHNVAIRPGGQVAHEGSLDIDTFSHSRRASVRRSRSHVRCFASLRSEEHTSELQSHSFISYAVFCL